MGGEGEREAKRGELRGEGESRMCKGSRKQSRVNEWQRGGRRKRRRISEERERERAECSRYTIQG